MLMQTGAQTQLARAAVPAAPETSSLRMTQPRQSHSTLTMIPRRAFMEVLRAHAADLRVSLGCAVVVHVVHAVSAVSVLQVGRDVPL